MNTNRRIISISVSPALDKQITAYAKSEDRSRSELLKEAFRVYQFYKDWSKIRIWGRDTSLRMGIESYDNVEKIAG